METLSFEEVAEKLGLKKSRVHQLVKEHRLLVVKDNAGQKAIVADSLLDTPEGIQPVEHLFGTMNLLLDGGFSHEEATEWLLSENDHFSETPLEVLRQGGHHRVNRVAAMLAF